MPALKWLREHGAHPSGERERVRQQATGWFNQVCTLFQAGLLTPEDLRVLTSRRQASLWLEHVAPLDRDVRVALGADPGVVHPVEEFWHRLAEGTPDTWPRH